MSSLLPAFTVGLDPTTRLLVLGALAYIVAGWIYVASTGIGGGIRRHEIGDGALAAVAAVLVWTAVTLLWPVPLAARTLRAVRRPRTVADPVLWRRQAVPPPALTPANTPPPWPAPPYWYRQRYEAARAVLAESGPVAALESVSGLLSDCALLLGDDHTWTLDAWDLVTHLAATAATADGACRADGVYRSLTFC